MLKRIKETLTCSDSSDGIRTKLKSHHLLHSDKSDKNTYFYEDKVKSLLYSSKISTIPLVLTVFGLLLVLGLMISPLDSRAVHAASDTSAGDDLKPSISLTIINSDSEISDNSTVSTEAKPGLVTYIDNIVRVHTNKIAKFYVRVQAASDGHSNLTGSTYGDTISGVDSNVSPTNFNDNTWGYALTSESNVDSKTLTYSTLPAYNSNSPLQYTSPMNPDNGEHDLKLTFAAKINANKPGDHYQTKVMISLAADPMTVTLDELTYMQQMFPEACESSTIGQSKTLTDKRDDSSYTVAKLSDGKCWMTQNLHIVNKPITPANSDVTSNYTIPASSSPWSDTKPTTNKVHYANNTTYGAYYTWYTATAGTSTSVSTDGQNASSSICPKGWRLPTGNTTGEFQALYSKGSAKVGDFTINSNSGYWLGGTSSAASGATFFPAGGYVGSGSLQNAGSDGYYWSSTARSATNAYSLYFYSSNVNPSSNGYYRLSGFSVRCVAR